MDFLYTDDPLGLADDIDTLGKAVAQAFGIVSGWVSDQEVDRMISNDMAPDGCRVYQIACLPCRTALRRALSAKEMEAKKFITESWVQMVHDGFRSEVPCRHFDQFETFVEGVEGGGKYSMNIMEEIKVHARLIEVGKS